MDVKAKGNVQRDEEEDQIELRRGPWTVEEDLKLVNYIASHGEGRWNSLALFAGNIIILLITTNTLFLVVVYEVVLFSYLHLMDMGLSSPYTKI